MIGESDDRPWGSWTIIDEGAGFKVKRIEVKPHARLSDQTHEHRAEHWVVASGVASSIIDGSTVVARVGECVDIAIQQPHRIVNDTDEPLVIIEIQRGDYLGEDDITRLEDDFGRSWSGRREPTSPFNLCSRAAVVTVPRLPGAASPW